MLESKGTEETSKAKVAVPPPRATVLPHTTEPEAEPPTTIAFTPRRWAFGDPDEGVL